VTTIWRRDAQQWMPTYPGVECMDLHRHPSGGGAALFRMVAGAIIPEHDHPRGEHTYVIAGELEMGEHRVGAGDALWTAPGERHRVRAITDAMFMGVAPPPAEVG
jgi:quercetin dioxygenase-like cupin family protein